MAKGGTDMRTFRSLRHVRMVCGAEHTQPQGGQNPSREAKQLPTLQEEGQAEGMCYFRLLMMFADEEYRSPSTADKSA